jgi:hypothetical protein
MGAKRSTDDLDGQDDASSIATSRQGTIQGTSVEPAARSEHYGNPGDGKRRDRRLGKNRGGPPAPTSTAPLCFAPPEVDAISRTPNWRFGSTVSKTSSSFAGQRRNRLVPATRPAAVVETDVHSLFLIETTQADAPASSSREGSRH